MHEKKQVKKCEKCNQYEDVIDFIKNKIDIIDGLCEYTDSSWLCPELEKIREYLKKVDNETT
jgi:hypothetical protein